VIFKNITEKKITQRSLEIVSTSVFQGKEQSFFDNLVKQLSGLLQVPYAMIGEVDYAEHRLDLKALYAHKKLLRDVSFPLKDTPCEVVITTGEMKYYHGNLQELFPMDKDLVDWGVESYLGFPLRNSNKEVIGHLVVMDTMALKNPELAKTVLQIFSNRVASEMERERYQKKLKQSNEELKMVNSELDRFVYSAAHDIRAPVSSVLGLINISEEQEDIEIIKHYLSLQKSSLRKLDLFITDLINYSINKRREVANDLIDLPELVNEVIDQYKYLSNFSHIDIQKDIKLEAPFFSDKNRLKLILNNLISNAINYADLGKENPIIKIDIVVKDHSASVSVWDNGQGIASDQIKKIFEMFHRANKHSKGSGIGLYITKEAVEKLGGNIEVQSQHKEWTTFSFQIINQMQAQENLKVSS
jgi:signal transduction histidine kinase